MRAEGRLFRLSPRVLELGRPYLSSLTLPEIAFRICAISWRRCASRRRSRFSTAATSSTSRMSRRSGIMSVPVTRRDARPGLRDRRSGACCSRVRATSGWAASLATLQLEPITGSTIVDPDALLAELRAHPQAGLGARRSGAGGGAARVRGADPRRARACDRRGERRRAREPLDDRRDPRRPPPTTPAHHRRHRVELRATPAPTPPVRRKPAPTAVEPAACPTAPTARPISCSRCSAAWR